MILAVTCLGWWLFSPHPLLAYHVTKLFERSSQEEEYNDEEEDATCLTGLRLCDDM
jgi:hypothetical protein